MNRTTLVFAKKSDLTSPPAHAIDMNETGGTLVTGGLNLVWSGTKRDGTRDPGFHCLDWTSAAGTESGTVGNYRETTTWTRYALDPHEICDKTRPIYCFEQ